MVATNHRAEIRGAMIAIHGYTRALVARGHDVTLLQAAKPEHQRPLEGVHTLYVSNTTKSQFPLLMALRSLRDFDVIHANDLAGAFFALRSRFARLPLVVEFHAPKVHAEGFWQAGWRWRYTGIAARNAPRVLTPSAWLGRELRARYSLDPERMHVIPHGIGEHWFAARAPEVERPGEGVRVVLVNMKGVDIALEAFARAGGRERARLELYGLHKDTDAYRGRARELGIEDRVEFRGFVPNTELPARLAGADVALNPTRADNFPQVLLETAALGIPAITAPVGGIPEIVVDGETGIHCPVDDVEAFAKALELLLSDAALRERMAGAARARAERRWRWASVVERLETEVYAPLARVRDASVAGDLA